MYVFMTARSLPNSYNLITPFHRCRTACRISVFALPPPLLRDSFCFPLPLSLCLPDWLYFFLPSRRDLLPMTNPGGSVVRKGRGGGSHKGKIALELKSPHDCVRRRRKRSNSKGGDRIGLGNGPLPAMTVGGRRGGDKSVEKTAALLHLFLALNASS